MPKLLMITTPISTSTPSPTPTPPQAARLLGLLVPHLLFTIDYLLFTNYYFLPNTYLLTTDD